MDPAPPAPASRPKLAVVLSGGGARAAYQVGFLGRLAERRPDLAPPILVGVSAGAINVASIAAHRGSFGDALAELGGLWNELTPERVMDSGAFSMWRTAVRWALRLAAGGLYRPKGLQGLIGTQPLRELLLERLGAGPIAGIQDNLASGRLDAVAVTTTSYTSGRSVTFCQGRDVDDWERPLRTSLCTYLTVEHVLASSALPLLFPAIRLQDGWYGDGGVRLTTPFAPAIHLGAERILALSTRVGRRSPDELGPLPGPYPPPVQVAGILLNAIFLDQFDGDALRLERVNDLIAKLPPEERGGLRQVDLLVVRPSKDLGRLANEYEPRLPRSLRFFSRGTGTLETRSNDLLSLIMFQEDYIRTLVKLGRRDADAQEPELAAFLDG